MKKYVTLTLIILSCFISGCSNNVDNKTSNKNLYEIHYFNGVEIEKYIAYDISYFDTNRIKISTENEEIILNGAYKIIYK